MLKSKKALAGALVALIAAILFFILVVRPVYHTAEAAILGSKPFSGPLGDFINELTSMTVPLRQIPIQLGEGAAVIGFRASDPSDSNLNDDDWECWNCYKTGLTIKFPRPAITECNKKNCICLCENIQFSSATPKVGGCGKDGKEVPICIDINQNIPVGDKSKEIKDKTALAAGNPPVYWQNGFLFANKVEGANGLGRTEGLMTALMVEKKSDGTKDILGVCNGEIIKNINEQLGTGSCIDGYAKLEELGLIGDNKPDTWKYGGVIVFEKDSTEGSDEKSEVILHDVLNFEKGSYINGNDKISAVKILGKCIVKLMKQGGTLNRELTGPGEFKAPSDFTNNDAKKLLFYEKNCLGNSIKVYEHRNYNENDDGGVQLFIDNNPDLRDVDFVEDDDKVNDKISSVRFAHDELFTVTFYKDLDYKGEDVTLSKSINIPPTLEDKVTSILLNSQIGRQAGVIIYEDPGFINGRQEVFIASDKNLQTGSFLQHDKASALKIIGQYRVTLYADNNFMGKWVEFDNTINPPTYKVKYNLAQNPATGNVPADSVVRNTLEIRNLNDDIYCIDDDYLTGGCGNSFEDDLNSIKIELPKAIYNTQNLGATCTTNFCQV